MLPVSKITLNVSMLAALLLSTAGQAADQNGNFVLRGAGSQPCTALVASINSRDKTASTTYLAWAQGYLSANNRLLKGTFDVMPTQGPGDFLGVIKAICDKAPQMPVENAANQAVLILRPLHQATDAPIVKLAHKGKTAEIRATVLAQLETKLIGRGLLRGEATAKPSGELYAAIEKFQTSERLTVTGLPDLATLLRAQASVPAK